MEYLDSWNFPCSYLYHDCGFQYGGLYIRYPGETTFKFRLMTCDQVNDTLEATLPFEGATRYDKFAITAAVRAASPWTWDKKTRPIRQREERRLGGVKVYDKGGNLIENN